VEYINIIVVFVIYIMKKIIYKGDRRASIAHIRPEVV